jgi:hypothetical protein
LAKYPPFNAVIVGRLGSITAGGKICIIGILYHKTKEGAAKRIIYILNNTVKNIRPYCMYTRQAVVSDTAEDDSAPHKPYTLKRSTLANTNTRERKILGVQWL